MIIGETLWHEGIIGNMTAIKLNKKMIYTYKDIPNCIYESLLNAANINPNAIAIHDNELRNYTYQELLSLVDQCAAYLKHQLKVKKADHIGLLLYSDIHFCVCFYAISKLSAICIPLPTKYRKQEVDALIDKADLDVLIYHQDFTYVEDSCSYQKVKIMDNHSWDKLDQPNEMEEYKFLPSNLEDHFIIMFTSGTTSLSKGVVLTNYNVMHAIISYQRILEISTNDRTLIAVPMYHITGLIALLGLFIHCGASIYLYKKYDPIKILNCIYHQHITYMHGSPTVFSKLLDYKNKFPELRSLRALGCGSSYTPLRKMQEFHEWLPYTKFQVIYGMTETASPALICPYDNPTSIYPKAAGLLIPGMQLKILDDNNQELTINQVGQIWIKGTNVTSQYYHLESELIDDNGWLNTGDLGYFNQDNYVFIVDRKKDMINRGGEKIWSKDVEEAINGYPTVIDCAVVAIPDEVYGEVAGAVVVTKQTTTQQQIKTYLKQELATFKIPKIILFVDEIYKTKGLKVDKNRIKQLFLK